MPSTKNRSKNKTKTVTPNILRYIIMEYQNTRNDLRGGVTFKDHVSSWHHTSYQHKRKKKRL